MPGAGFAPARQKRKKKPWEWNTSKRRCQHRSIMYETSQSALTYLGPKAWYTAARGSGRCRCNSSRPRFDRRGRHAGRRLRGSEGCCRCRTQEDHRSCRLRGTTCLPASAARKHWRSFVRAERSKAEIKSGAGWNNPGEVSAIFKGPTWGKKIGFSW